MQRKASLLQASSRHISHRPYRHTVTIDTHRRFRKCHRSTRLRVYQASAVPALPLSDVLIAYQRGSLAIIQLSNSQPVGLLCTYLVNFNLTAGLRSRSTLLWYLILPRFWMCLTLWAVAYLPIQSVSVFLVTSANGGLSSSLFLQHSAPVPGH